jgi:subtilisin family serine protease
MKYVASELEFSGFTPGITANLYDCGLGYPTNFPAAVRGNIALIARGTLFFSEKVANAMAAGARAAVIYNNTNGNIQGTLQYSSNWIPAIGISQADGLALKAALPAMVTVVNAIDPTKIYAYLDGTSMAAPHVAAAVAFAALNFPNEKVAARIQRVLANVDSVPALQGKLRTGGRLNLQRMLDSDLNGLPDWWEQMHFGQLTGTDPNADPDHDGASNVAEWLADTDPMNASSAFRILSAQRTGDDVRVTWTTVGGHTYRVQFATDGIGPFADLDPSITVGGTGESTTNYLHVAGGAKGAGYYRVRRN